MSDVVPDFMEFSTERGCGWCAGVTGEKVRCWCARCHSEHVAGYQDLVKQLAFNHMYLCPDCGNKRCPKSTYHGNACTGSNEPGQPGSAYGGLPPDDSPQAQLFRKELAEMRRARKDKKRAEE